MEFIAASAFGLEGIVKQELLDLGFDAKAEQGGARFQTDLTGACKANLFLACADRVLLILGERKVSSFEELFEFVLSIPFEQHFPKDANFPVNGNCVRSQLMSVRDCQSITKKAIVERLKRKYKVNWFPETGDVYPVTITIHRDIARLTLDTSGDALNKRGYRTWVGEAPLRETLAAAMVRLSGWMPEHLFYDPCCGTGTLLIEAAFLAQNRAPGLHRSFIMEQWQHTDQAACHKLREEAKALYIKDAPLQIAGSDINPEALSLCKKHLQQAGLASKITVQQMDLRDVRLHESGVYFVTNPPYGERIGDQKKAAKIAQSLGELFRSHEGARLCAITADHGFERHARQRATQRRRLYNGRLECEFLVMESRPQIIQ
ncbi:MAG: class I SAM-dependent RNA methyltransferase [Clostridiales bacterium]|nr:class I SAM-dependent RNA methyltransferase [Clostridiales bacterium]